jgi:dTDP-4-amino-4,6-dideoxygalactose transaminase
MPEAFLPYCRPDIGEDEIRAVTESMRAGWLTTGPATARFESEFAAASSAPFAVALNSCTAGLHLVMAAMGIGPGDEVIMPSLTFVAGAQCALELGAMPVFCDVEPDTLCASVRTIAPAITPKTKLIIAMPYAGRPMAMEELCAFAASLHIRVIEDAAHGAGTLDRGAWPGTHSTAAIYSFYATKNIATGEGGMLTTADEALADRVRRLSLHGMSRDAWQRYTNRGSWRYDVTEAGFKYNLPDLAASIGIVQLRRLSEMQAARDSIAARYKAALSQVPGLSFQRELDNAGDRHSWCMFPVTIDARESGIDRDAFIDEMRDCGVGTSVHYIPTHTFSGYASLARGPLPETEAAAAKLVSLPLYPTMSDADVDRVIAAVRRVTAVSAWSRTA